MSILRWPSRRSLLAAVLAIAASAVLAIAAVEPAGAARAGVRTSGVSSHKPEPSSEQTSTYKTENLELRFPENWHVDGQQSQFALYPDGGKVNVGKGQTAFSYGVLANLFDPGEGKFPSLDEATDRLVRALQRQNPNMQVSRSHEKMHVSGRDARSTYLTNESPAGGRETDWLVAMRWNDAVFYFVCVAPEGEFGAYEKTFKQVVSSLRLKH